MFLVKILSGLGIGGALGAVMGHFGSCSTGACPLTASPWRGAFFGSVIGLLFALSLCQGCGSANRKPAARKFPEGKDP